MLKKPLIGRLRRVILDACKEIGCKLGELTVLSPENDPYRLDTEAGHRDGKWAAEQVSRFYRPTRKLHWRGLHYSLVGKVEVRKPNGKIFINTHADWKWLQETAGKAARWLGYIDFERINDQRSDEPVIYRRPRVDPFAYVQRGLCIALPELKDTLPVPEVQGFEERQKYQFVIYGEKSSLEEVARPIAEAKQADLYLQIGEISETRAYQIAKDAVEDGRPLIVFTLIDCDPSGHQMSVSIARKLQALRDFKPEFASLRFEVVPAALTVDQVKELGLPSKPLKPSEKRADKWKDAFGVEQTEIDALLTQDAVDEGTLAELIERAFDSYFDRTLAERVATARAKWLAAAKRAIKKRIDKAALDEATGEAEALLDEFRQRISEINELYDAAVSDVVLPKIDVPEAEIDPDVQGHAPLVSLDDDWVTATRKLIAHKSYGRKS
jgi:hypothetical protein